MKALTLTLTAVAAVTTLAISTPVLAGDPVIGKQKAVACIACHGNDVYPGIFFTLQLAGRNADKMAVKTMKYKTLKILHPMMAVSTAFFDEKEIQDITSYYQSLGKPAFTSPLIKIKGDEDEPAQTAAAPYGYGYPAYPAVAK